MKMPNGYGSVYNLGKNRRKPWAVRLTIGRELRPDGTTHWKYKYLGYYSTKEEAFAALVQYNQNPYDLDAAKITFSEVYSKWSAEHFPKVSESNIKGSNAAYKLCKNIQDMRFADIRKSHLQGIVDTCDKNYPTLRKLKVLFNQLFKYAMENDICSKDYSRYVDISSYKDKNPDKIDRFIFTDSEIRMLWEWSNNEYVGIILILIYTGVRVGEMRDLKKNDVNLKEKYFRITASKTPAGIRSVPIADKILPFFEHWMDKPGEYVFSTKDGRHLTYRNYRDAYWNQLIQEMGLNQEHHPHDTRHTCISLLVKAGTDERLIKRIVGHAGKGVTEQVYTHIDLEQMREAINKISGR